MILRNLYALLALFLLGGPAAAEDWAGDWDTTYGQLRLSQVGDRVHGDYAERGRIEARTSPDGGLLRGTFVYADGRWGMIEFRRDGPAGFGGQWIWNAGDVAEGTAWNGTRDTDMPSPLRFPGGAEGWPDTTADDLEAIEAFVQFGDVPDDAPVVDPSLEMLGFWYGSYEISGLPGFAAIALEVDQLRGGTTGLVNMTLQVLDVAACPPEMHPHLCAEIQSLGKQGTLTLPIEGVGFQDGRSGQEAFVAFRVADGYPVEVLKIVHGGEPDTYWGTILHPQRGVDWEGVVLRGPHLCDVAPCMAGRFAPLTADPDAALGMIDEAGFFDAYDPERDWRMRARADMGPEDGSKPGPGDRMMNGDAWMAEKWAIVEETGNPLGGLTFARDAGGRLTATGGMDAGTFATPPEATDFTVLSEDAARIEIAFQIFADGSSEQAQGRLSFAHPDAGDATGTLTMDGQTVQIELVPIGSMDWRLGDAPAFGVHLPEYGLRGVPGGSDLILRDAPDIAAVDVGRIRRDASSLSILSGCEPYVDPIIFETADREGRERLLDSVWCDVVAPSGARGWIKGRYLTPLD